MTTLPTPAVPGFCRIDEAGHCNTHKGVHPITRGNHMIIKQNWPLWAVLVTTNPELFDHEYACQVQPVLAWGYGESKDSDPSDGLNLITPAGRFGPEWRHAVLPTYEEAMRSLERIKGELYRMVEKRDGDKPEARKIWH